MKFMITFNHIDGEWDKLTTEEQQAYGGTLGELISALKTEKDSDMTFFAPVEQAKTAALSLLGESHAYAQVPWFWSDQFDLKLQIAGLSGDHDRVVVRGNPDDASFSAFYLRSGKLIAVDAVNSPRDFMAGKQLIAAETVVDAGQLADSTTTLFDLI